MKSHLKDEVEKVEKINPERYIIATSTELNPNDKSEIKNLFGSYCKNESDIFGREDILNFLRSNDDIVKKHPKLWFTSSSVLEIILDKAIFNHTDIDIENFTIFLPKMVITDEFLKVEEILKKENVCIVSGEPGIGKSTLMKGLVIKYSANDYQPIIISGNIRDALKLIDKNKKQIFYYDDFLGSTYYNEVAGKNEEKSIESFILAVRRYKGNIKFILTTREYVLNQAQQKSESAKRFGDYEYIISLNNASTKIKAEILYNHLWHSDIGNENISKMIEDQNYLKIINHSNFNPRIIETMTKSILVNHTDFIESFLYALNYPENIWNTVFESSISDYSRTNLVLLGIFDKRINLNKLFEYFCKYFSESEKDMIKLRNNFELSLKELNGSLISIENYPWNSDFFIQYKNPSVKDFISTKITKEDVILAKLCDCIDDIDPLVEIWNIFKNQKKTPDIDKFPKFCEKYFLAIKKYGEHCIETDPSYKLKKLTIHLLSLSDSLKCENHIQYTNYFLERILKKIETGNIHLDDINIILSNLRRYQDTYPSYWRKYPLIIKKYLLSKNYSYISEYSHIVDFLIIAKIELEPSELDTMVSKLNILAEKGIEIEINEKTKEPLIFEYNIDDGDYAHSGSDINDLEKIKAKITDISDFFDVDASDILDEIDSKIRDYYDNYEYEPDEDEYKYQRFEDEELEEKLGIQHLFEGLLEKNPI